MFYHMINKDNLNYGFRRHESTKIVNDTVFPERLHIQRVADMQGTAPLLVVAAIGEIRIIYYYMNILYN